MQQQRQTNHHLVDIETKLSKQDPRKAKLLKMAHAQTMRVNPPSLRDSINLDSFFMPVPKNGMPEGGSLETAGLGGLEGFEDGRGGGEGSELSSTTFNYMMKEDSVPSAKASKPRIDLGPAKIMAQRNAQKISLVLELCEKVDCKKTHSFTGIRRPSQMLDFTQTLSPHSDGSVNSGVIFGMKGSHDWISPSDSAMMIDQPCPPTPSSRSSFLSDGKGNIASPVHTDPWPYGLRLPRRNPQSRRARHPQSWDHDFVYGHTLSPKRWKRTMKSLQEDGHNDFRELMKRFSSVLDKKGEPMLTSRRLSDTQIKGRDEQERLLQRVSERHLSRNDLERCPIVGVSIDIENLSHTAMLMESRIIQAYVSRKNVSRARRGSTNFLPTLLNNASVETTSNGGGLLRGSSGGHGSGSNFENHPLSHTPGSTVLGPETSANGPIFKSELTPISESASLNSRALSPADARILWDRLLLSLKECAIDVDFRDLVELQCTRKPHPSVAACIGYLCVLLGQKPTWETAKKTLFTGLIPLHKFLFEVNPEAISVRRLKSAIYFRATALQGETVHSLAMVSIPAGKLMKWIYAMHFIGLLLVTGYELRGDGEEGRRMSFFSDLDPFASSDSEMEGKNLVEDPTQRKHQHQHREVGGSHYQPHRLKRLMTNDNSNSPKSETSTSPKQGKTKHTDQQRPFSENNDESERMRLDYPNEWTIGEEAEGMLSPVGASEGDMGGGNEGIEGGRHSHSVETGQESQPQQQITKMAGGGIKKATNKKTGKLEPLIGNESSLSTTQKQQKEKFRSYEIYRKQSERIYQRLREAKSQRGFRNEDDMMNFFRVLESTDTTVASSTRGTGSKGIKGHLAGTTGTNTSMSRVHGQNSTMGGRGLRNEDNDEYNDTFIYDDDGEGEEDDDEGAKAILSSPKQEPGQGLLPGDLEPPYSGSGQGLGTKGEERKGFPGKPGDVSDLQSLDSAELSVPLYLINGMDAPVSIIAPISQMYPPGSANRPTTFGGLSNTESTGFIGNINSLSSSLSTAGGMRKPYMYAGVAGAKDLIVFRSKDPLLKTPLDQARQKNLDAQKEKAVKRSSSPPVTKPIRSHPSWYKASSTSPSDEQNKQDWPDAKDMKNNGGDVLDGLGNSLDAPSATSMSDPMINNTIAPAKTIKSTDTTKGDGLAKGQTGGAAKKASTKETSNGNGNGSSNPTNRGGSSQASPSRLSEPKSIRQKVSTGNSVIATMGKEDKGVKEAKNSVGSSTPSKPTTAGGTQRGGDAKSEAKTTTTTSTVASRGSKEIRTTAASKPSTASTIADAKNDGGKGKQPEKKEEKKKQAPSAMVDAVPVAVAKKETKDDGGRIEVKGTNHALGGDDGDEYGEEEFEPGSRPGSAESKAHVSSSSVVATSVVIPSTETSQPSIQPDNNTEVSKVEVDVVASTSTDDNNKDDALPSTTAVEQEPAVNNSSNKEMLTVVSDPVPTTMAQIEVVSPSVVIEEASPSVDIPTSSSAVVNDAVATNEKEDEYGDESFEATSRPGSASGSPEKPTEATKETTIAETTTTAAVSSTEAITIDKQEKEDDDLYLSDSDDNHGSSEKEKHVKPSENKETGLEEKKADKPKESDKEYDFDF